MWQNFIWCLRYKSLIIICLINYNLQKVNKPYQQLYLGFSFKFEIYKFRYNFYDSIIYPLQFKWFMIVYYFIKPQSLTKTSIRRTGGKFYTFNRFSSLGFAEAKVNSLYKIRLSLSCLSNVGFQKLAAFSEQVYLCASFDTCRDR